MTRWKPDARGRLEKAAMELFLKRGYGRTTVEEIAARAGLTERTFFRYFADKREVLFSGSKDLEKTIVDRIASAPEEATPLDAVSGALGAAGAWLQARRDLEYVRARHALVTQHAELRERELIKFASLSAAITRALRERGVPEPSASLAAEAGLAIFKVGFERWLCDEGDPDLATRIRAVTAALREIASAPASAGSSKLEVPTRRAGATKLGAPAKRAGAIKPAADVERRPRSGRRAR